MIDLREYVQVERVTRREEQFFFGYYDLSPESPSGSRVLSNRAYFIDHMPQLGDAIDIGYFDVGSNEFKKIGCTYAWNFQEGCRLQWLDDSHIIYNDRCNGELCSKIYDVERNLVVQTYSMPIYSISRRYMLATTYGFINNKYSYAHTEKEAKEDKCGKGVYLVDLRTGQSELILSVDSLAEATGSKEFHNWVEYCSISPDGKRFFLIHRWDKDGVLMGNQLCVSDFNGNINILMNSKFISHVGWRGDDELSCWARMPSGINSLQRNSFFERTGIFSFAKSIFHMIVKKPSMRQKFTNDAYILFDLNEHSNKKISNSDFTSDGHCSWSKDKRYMLTDTYPDMENMRGLLLYDALKDKVFLLGKFYSIPVGIKDMKWGQSSMRCDLHPKWGFDEKNIYFDSVHEGFRGLYRIDVMSVKKVIDEHG